MNIEDRLFNKMLDDLNTCFSQYHTEQENISVTLKDIDVTINPFVISAKENVVTTGYYLNAPDWDRRIFEMCSAVGESTNNALGMAQASFMFALMDCVIKLRTKQEYVRFESKFNGRTHKWKVYIGNILGMGENLETNTDTYWNALKEQFSKRLGNQKICYVKIFAANSGTGEYVEGECRVNNLRSDDLSKIVEDIAKNFDCSSFTSQKQFFIFEQEDETREDYPHTEREIIGYTRAALQLYEKCIYEDKTEDFFELLELHIGDTDLAEEIYDFIPEICAETVFTNIPYPDSFTISVKDNEINCYKTQLYTYSTIYDAVFENLNEDVLNDPKKVRDKLVMNSSVASIVSQLFDKGYTFEQLSNIYISTIHTMNDDYVLR